MGMMTLRSALPVAFCLSVLVMAGTASAEPSIADIQWAQRVLTEKGFDIGGRANGQMTAQTHKALKAYQSANGLPASGELDNATVDKMMAGRKAQPTMGTLGAPRPGTDRRNLEKDVVPRAAPTQRVTTDEGGDVINTPSISGGAMGGGDPNWTPSAGAPSGSRSGSAGAVPTTGGAAPAMVSPNPSADLSATTRTSWSDYARPAAAATFAGTLLALLGAWWMSGRRRRSSGDAPAPTPAHRREPVFERPTGSRRRGDPDQGPSLTASRPKSEPRQEQRRFEPRDMLTATRPGLSTRS
jgi:peptidoglycan hydrolase-like protein with peptidoglycan-binding domain